MPLKVRQIKPPKQDWGGRASAPEEGTPSRKERRESLGDFV
jgi:hypothetical protein